MCEYPEDEWIQLSSLQHFSFCPRQCYLAHAEQQWGDNQFTTAGTLMHERVDSGESENVSSGFRQARSLQLCSRRYGLSGQADLLEFDTCRRKVYPVEYKLGRPKSGDCDRIQLCAQALCLEEMLDIPVPSGAIYYGKTHRRLEIELTPDLRDATIRRISEVHQLLRSEIAPPPLFSRVLCPNCSLRDLCLPTLSGHGSAMEYLERELRDS